MTDLLDRPISEVLASLNLKTKRVGPFCLFHPEENSKENLVLLPNLSEVNQRICDLCNLIIIGSGFRCKLHHPSIEQQGCDADDSKGNCYADFHIHCPLKHHLKQLLNQQKIDGSITVFLNDPNILDELVQKLIKNESNEGIFCCQ